MNSRSRRSITRVSNLKPAIKYCQKQIA